MSTAGAPPPPSRFAVPSDAAGLRLDRFLVRVVAGATASDGPGPSRAELQRWIEGGHVKIDGRPAKAADKLRKGALIEVERPPPARTTAVPESGIDFRVLHVDESLVVIDKPAGLVVHPARGHAGGTLVNGLLALGLFDAESIADAAEEADVTGHVRPGIVHRLDKGTSGVIVVARTARAREALKAQFAAHTIERAYEAICAGIVEPGTRATLHGRHPTDRLKFTTRVTTGKRAVTHVRVLERLAGATHVECTLETGRTHQIRVHLAEGGTPILGDPLYGRTPKDIRLKSVAETLGHQALHARVLGFIHPTSGEAVRFESPVPADFRWALDVLRGA